MDDLSDIDDNQLRVRRSWPLAIGLLVLACLWLGPLPEMARRAFSPHMILHLGVAVVAAPLIVIGLRRLLWTTGSPRLPLLAAIAASAFEVAVVWGWHAPAMHEAAARLPHVFALQQASFLTAGLVLWWICVDTCDRKTRALGGLAMLFTSMHMAMLGMLLVLAPTLVYSPQYCLGAFGLDPIADQQFGGGMMTLFGALPFVAGGAWQASRLATKESHQERGLKAIICRRGDFDR